MSYVFTAEQVCLQSLARMIWEKRGQAKRVGLPFGEETVTETFLLDLALTYPGAVTIVPFTKWVEGKNGSDWAWSFESADRAYSYPMMVQAKVLDVQDKDYGEIKRTIGNSTDRQIDRLMEVSQRLGFPAYYAFYNHLSDLTRVPNNCTSLQMTNGAPMPESWGISIAEANKVLGTLPDQSFDKHRAHSIPLHCLLCSGGTGARGLFGTPGRVARQIGAGDEDWTFPSGTPGEPPPGVRRGTDPLFDVAGEAAVIDSPEHRDYLIGQLREKYPGVDGVVIIRDGKKP
jgi:hypothetical protein